MLYPTRNVDEHRAMLKLRLWLNDRQALKHGRTPLQRPEQGKSRPTRKSSLYDARIVRVIDFERQFQKLTTLQQAVLILTCVDKQHDEVAAALLHCSRGTIANQRTRAIADLARLLDQRDLL